MAFEFTCCSWLRAALPAQPFFFPNTTCALCWARSPLRVSCARSVSHWRRVLAVRGRQKRPFFWHLFSQSSVAFSSAVGAYFSRSSKIWSRPARPSTGSSSKVPVVWPCTVHSSLAVLWAFPSSRASSARASFSLRGKAPEGGIWETKASTKQSSEKSPRIPQTRKKSRLARVAAAPPCTGSHSRFTSPTQLSTGASVPVSLLHLWNSRAQCQQPCENRGFCSRSAASRLSSKHCSSERWSLSITYFPDEAPLSNPLLLVKPVLFH